MDIEGTILVRMAATYEFYTPPFPRGGPRGCFTIYFGEGKGTGTVALLWSISHRNFGDPTWAVLVTEYSISTPATQVTLDYSNLKEELRYRFRVGGTDNANTVHFVMLEPRWCATP